MEDEMKKKNWFREAIQEIKDTFHRNVERKTAATKKTNPRTYGLFVVIFVIILIVGGLIVYNNLSNSNTGQNQTGIILSSQSGNKCKNFNIEDWQTGQGQLIQEGNLLSIASTSSNGMLRYKEFIPLSSDIKITFVPYSEEQINFVLHAHDLYEIVIGDGGYQGVTLKASPGSGQSMKTIKNIDGYKRNIFEKGELSPGTDITVVLDQGISRLEDNSYEVNIRIKYRYGLEDDEEKLFATYDFPLPPKFNYEETNMRFSIGLLTAGNGTKVSTEILCFEVSPN